MNVRYLRASTLIFVCAAGSALAQAERYTLVCDMTDYGMSFVQPDFKELVPPHTNHAIDGASAHMTGSRRPGKVEDKGSSTTILYRGNLKDVGDVTVEYVFYRSTGMTFVKTKSVRNAPYEAAPEAGKRQAKYTVRGHCRIQ